MHSSRTLSIASILASAGMAVASVGGGVAVTPAGQTAAQASERSAPTQGALNRLFAQADARKRFTSPARLARPERVRPRSTGSHKQNRRRALAAR